MKYLILALLLFSSGLAAQQPSFGDVDPDTIIREPAFSDWDTLTIAGVAFGAWQEHIYHTPKIKRNCMDRDFMDVVNKVVDGMYLFRQEKPAKFAEAGLPLAAFGVMHVIYPCMEKDRRPTAQEITENGNEAIASQD